MARRDWSVSKDMDRGSAWEEKYLDGQAFFRLVSGDGWKTLWNRTRQSARDEFLYQSRKMGSPERYPEFSLGEK